jgi:Ca-activated chloride channel family protein
MEKVNGLIPKGKTPMVRSVRQTVESIKHLEEETTILLVSDGVETCDDDPCGLVAELQNLGIRFVLHVVGFDVSGDTEAQLKCMAAAGNGEYFQAEDAGKLKAAFHTVIEKAVARNLIVACVDDKDAPVSVMISVIDSSGNIVASDGGERVSFGLAPGTYTLKVNPDALSGNMIVDGVTVTADKVAERKLVFAKSQVVVSMEDGSGKNIPGYVRIVDLETDQYAEEGDHKGEKTVFIVSPGEYQVDMECSNTGRRIKSEAFSLGAGDSRNVDCICADARIGVLVVDADGNPITGYIRIVEVETDTYFDEKDSHSTMLFFEVPPGRYKVDVECPDESRLRSMPFDILQGEENRVRVNCGTGAIETSLPN